MNGVTHLMWQVILGNKLKKFGNHCGNRSIPRMTTGSIRVGTTKKDIVVTASFHSNGSLAVFPSTKMGVGCVLNSYYLSLILNQRSCFHVVPSVPPLTTTRSSGSIINKCPDCYSCHHHLLKAHTGRECSSGGHVRL